MATSEQTPSPLMKLRKISTATKLKALAVVVGILLFNDTIAETITTLQRLDSVIAYQMNRVGRP